MNQLRGLAPAADGDMATMGSPPMPVPAEMTSWPFLVAYSRHLSVGWQARRQSKGGQCFLVGRETVTGDIKVLQRFPFTEQGWIEAWRYLLAHDAALEAEIRVKLAAAAEAARTRRAVAELNQRTVVRVRDVQLLGGYAPDLDLPTGQRYDLRFLQERLIVVRAETDDVLLDCLYGDIEEIEIGGPGTVDAYARAQQAGMILAFGLLGAVVVDGVTKIETIIRVQVRDRELFFLCTTTAPDQLRILLSRPLGTIRDARAGRARAAAPQPSDASVKIAELDRLASLLDAGLLSRDEFNQLKSQLLAGS